MISQLTGKIVFKENNFLIINVSGVGYKVFVSNDTISELNKKEESVTIWTFQVVRENALDLYGFLTKEDLDFFELIISVSGIGPKTGLGILNVATTNSLVSAISTGDTSYLTKVSGIGPKSAQKIVLELSDKVKKLNIDSADIREEVDVVEALVSLGYSTKQASDSLQKVNKEVTGTGERVKEALKILSK